MERVDIEAKPAVVITRAQFEQDWQRGYAVTIYNPETEEILRDPRSGREIRRPVPAVLNFCCMRCLFSTIMVTVIHEHLEEGKHLWPFNPFTNPYGNIADVVVDGVPETDYDSIVKERMSHG